MPQTVGGAILEIIIDDGVVNQRAWADRAPDKATLPYVTFTDGVSTAPALKGDSNVIALDRMVQVSLWQDSKREDFTVPRTLYGLLNGTRVVLASGVKFRIAVTDTQRIPEADTHIVQHAFTLSIKHDPTAF